MKELVLESTLYGGACDQHVDCALICIDLKAHARIEIMHSSEIVKLVILITTCSCLYVVLLKGSDSAFTIETRLPMLVAGARRQTPVQVPAPSSACL